MTTGSNNFRRDVVAHALFCLDVFNGQNDDAGQLLELSFSLMPYTVILCRLFNIAWTNKFNGRLHIFAATRIFFKDNGFGRVYRHMTDQLGMQPSPEQWLNLLIHFDEFKAFAHNIPNVTYTAHEKRYVASFAAACLKLFHSPYFHLQNCPRFTMYHLIEYLAQTISIETYDEITRLGDSHCHPVGHWSHNSVCSSQQIEADLCALMALNMYQLYLERSKTVPLANEVALFHF